MHFRSGEKHSNHGNDAKEAVARVVKMIRNQYDEMVPMIKFFFAVAMCKFHYFLCFH